MDVDVTSGSVGLWRSNILPAPHRRRLLDMNLNVRPKKRSTKKNMLKWKTFEDKRQRKPFQLDGTVSASISCFLVTCTQSRIEQETDAAVQTEW